MAGKRKPANDPRFKAHNEAIAKLIAERSLQHGPKEMFQTQRAKGPLPGSRTGQAIGKRKDARDAAVAQIIEEAKKKLAGGQVLDVGTVSEDEAPPLPTPTFTPPPAKPEPTPTDVEQDRKGSARDAVLKALEEKYRKMAAMREDEDDYGSED